MLALQRTFGPHPDRQRGSLLSEMPSDSDREKVDREKVAGTKSNKWFLTHARHLFTPSRGDAEDGLGLAHQQVADCGREAIAKPFVVESHSDNGSQGWPLRLWDIMSQRSRS